MTQTLLRYLTLLALTGSLAQAAPLGTAFTYQGHLNAGGAAANGVYDLQFSVYDAQSGGLQAGSTLNTNGIGVSNGLFTATLNFGAGVFDGNARWLSVAVRTNGGAGFTVLSPRQPLTPAPYAVFAPNAAVAASATLASTATTANSVAQNAVTAIGIGSGQVVKGLNGLHDEVSLAAGANVTLTPSGQSLTLASPTDWHVGGNAGTTPGANFLGTSDSQPLELRVNNSRVLRFERSGDGYNVLGGHVANSIAANVVGATISGGGNALGSVGGYSPNSIAANYAFIGGGGGNAIQAGAFNGVIGGGAGNSLGAGAYGATVGGGYGNSASGPYSTVPGGYNNTASGLLSFAAGSRAQALHAGSFVWADSLNLTFASTSSNQFMVRARGGLQVFGGSLIADAGEANTNGTLNPAPGLVFGGTSSGEGIASKRLNDGQGNTWGLDFFTSYEPRLSIDNSGSLWVNDNTVYLHGFGDENHGIRYSGASRHFAGIAVDGPVLFGYSGGALGTEQFGAENIALAWKGNGSVGINTTNPGSTLDVNGDAAVRGSLFVNSKSTQNAIYPELPGILFGDINSGEVITSQRGTNGPNLYGLDFYTAYGKRLSIASSGNVGIGRQPTVNRLEVAGSASKDLAGSWFANSDARIKTDIAAVTNALETLARVRPVSFRYSDEYRAAHPSIEDRPYVNVVAQEFRAVFPDAVKSSGETLADGSEILQVDTYPLTLYSAAAIQELKQKLEARSQQLELESTELKKQVAELRALVKSLAEKVNGGGQ